MREFSRIAQIRKVAVFRHKPFSSNSGTASVDVKPTPNDKHHIYHGSRVDDQKVVRPCRQEEMGW